MKRKCNYESKVWNCQKRVLKWFYLPPSRYVIFLKSNFRSYCWLEPSFSATADPEREVLPCWNRIFSISNMLASKHNAQSKNWGTVVSQNGLLHRTWACNKLSFPVQWNHGTTGVLRTFGILSSTRRINACSYRLDLRTFSHRCCS